MPFTYNRSDCSPLVIDNEFEIHDEEKLAEYVGKIVLGYFAHIKRIINSLGTNSIDVSAKDVQNAKERLTSNGKSEIEIDKRDGWVFQIISWTALLIENKGKKYYCQQPHDAPAQHGLDGVSIILDDKLKIESIVITEDKCTPNQRVLIPRIWEEFLEFEEGNFNNKLVSRISAMIENLDGGKILEANENNIYKNELRQYRVGINRDDTYQEVPKKRIKLFKGYDGCIKGNSPHRRFASTIHKDDIRQWMDQFCNKVIQYLDSL